MPKVYQAEQKQQQDEPPALDLQAYVCDGELYYYILKCRYLMSNAAYWHSGLVATHDTCSR